MKKLLAMVLALVMTLSLAVSANAAFKDADKVSADYSEAVAVLNGMGVFKGYEDGSFQPQGNITRAEVATIIYRIYTQDLAKNDKSGLYASYNKFSDMAGAGWAAGYIGYCANAEFVKGYPDGTFKPSGNVTGYEVLTMILRAIGYDKNGEFTGADWALNVAKYAEQAGVLKNVKGVDLNAPATRELVAELLFRAIAKAPMVTYTAAFGYQTVSFSGSKADSKLFKDNETLGHKNFDLTPNATNGTYGRPATKWTYNCGDKSTTVYDKPVATYTEAVSACDLCKDLSEKKEATAVEQWIDGVKVVDSAKKAVSATYKATDTKTETGAQGQLTEVYANGDDYTVVYINTYLAKVTKVIEEVKDKNDHVKVEASVNVTVYGTETDKNGDVTAKVVSDSFETTGFAKNDYVLVTYDDGDIASMEAAKGEVAKLTGLKGNKVTAKTTKDAQDIIAVAYEDVDAAFKATLNPLAKGDSDKKVTLGETYTFYYDSYGNVIGVDDYTSDATYVVIDRIWADHDNGKVTYYADLVSVSDASLISKVVVDSIDGKTNITVNEKDSKNTAFYHDLMTYTVNKDGEYELRNVGTKVQHLEDKKAVDTLCTYKASDNKNLIKVADSAKGIYMDKETEILVQYTNSPEGTFKAYTIDTLPNSFWGYVEYVVDADNGYADVVYVRGADQTFSYVFIADATKLTTKENADDTITLTLKEAYTLTEDGKLDEKSLSVTSNSENVVITTDAYGNPLGSEEITKAGLYKMYTLGENNQYLVYVPAVKLAAVTEYSDKTVVGLYNNGKLISADDVNDFYWTGNFEGTDSKGSPYTSYVEETLSSSELAKFNVGDWVFVQFDNDEDEVVALHKLSLEVAVNGEYKGAEYFGTAFAPITVDIEDAQTYVGSPVMKNGEESIELQVTYYDKDGKVVNNQSADKVKAIIDVKDSTQKVTGDISYTLKTLKAYTNAEMVADTYLFTNQDQSAKVENNAPVTGIAGTITVDLKQATVSAGDLVTLLNKEAKANVNQTIAGVYNTQDVESSKVAADANLAGDMLVKVVAWDNKTVAYYRIAVTNAPSV